MKGVFNITPKLQHIYATRGMWADRKPRGVLSNMLGPVARLGQTWATGEREIAFYVTDEQIRALEHDMAEMGMRRMISAQQFVQSQRRLREALLNGENRSEALKSASRPNRPADPFRPLVCPPAGKARKAFEHHAMQCLRELVDFSQSTAWDKAG